MRVLVAGIGRFGGGQGALRYFADRGDEVLVTDRAAAEQYADVREAWAGRDQVHFVFGPEQEALIEGIDLLVPSPALPDDHVFLRAARARGIRIAGELELFLERCPVPVLAITGSNGKTTTAHLLAAMLREAGHSARLAGNMGISLLPEVERLDIATRVVVEISSFQLERLDLSRLLAAGFRFEGGILTSFAPNHLDRHPDLASYANAKARMFALIVDGGPLVLEGGSETEQAWRRDGSLSHLRVIPSRDATTLETQLRRYAPHGVAARNATQAALLGEAQGLFDRDVAERVIADFRPLDHRLEIVADDGRRRFVNDSKSTTPEATAAGVAAFAPPVHLVGGGHDKELDPHAFLVAARSCASVRLLGATAPLLAAALADHPDCRVFPDLDRLLDDVFERVRKGVVLLSPGHASYGLWREYRERGDDFRTGVESRLAALPIDGGTQSAFDSTEEND